MVALALLLRAAFLQSAGKLKPSVFGLPGNQARTLSAPFDTYTCCRTKP